MRVSSKAKDAERRRKAVSKREVKAARRLSKRKRTTRGNADEV